MFVMLVVLFALLTGLGMRVVGVHLIVIRRGGWAGSSDGTVPAFHQVYYVLQAHLESLKPLHDQPLCLGKRLLCRRLIF